MWRHTIFPELPGKKEEIILEWTPKGHNETVDKFLKTLPPELLPVRGSAAAQERKQLLQKQIPIHDIDPTLCHELTEPELLQMNEYIAHVKQSSVGIGHVVQLGLNHGSKHTIGLTEPQLLASRYPAQLSNAQVVQLHAAKNAAKLQNLSLEGRKALNVAEDTQVGVKPGQIVDYNYPVYERVTSPDVYLNYERERAHSPSYAERLGANSPQKQLPHYAPGTINRYNETQTPQKIASVRDLAFSTYDPQSVQNNYLPANRNLPQADAKLAEQRQGNANAKQLNIPTGDARLAEQLHNNANASHYPNTDVKLAEQRHNNANAPHYHPNAVHIGDITYPTTEQRYRNTPPPLNNTVSIGTRHTNAPHYHPNQINIPQDTLNPTAVRIGAITDITYPTTDVKFADDANQPADDANAPYYQPTDIKTTNLLSCHRCKKPFEDDAIVIGIERSEALFHAACFKCKGCNQNLADMVYFYHEESDDVYCGRDYAKIRGIPRCKACDELIFVKEYCLAENSTFHVKHFCCFECDSPLAGQNYVVEDAQPVCLPCFERIKANKCSSCFRVIKPDETGAQLKDLHFHVNDECFACKVCRKPLIGGKFLLRNQRLYCSTVCFGADQWCVMVVVGVKSELVEWCGGRFR